MKPLIVARFLSLAAALVLIAPTFVSAQEFRINGASTTVGAVINPNKEAVEKSTGLTLAVVGTNSGKGLVALNSGQCDLAAVSEPLDIAAMGAKLLGLEINPADYQLHTVKEDYAAFAVNLANPVKSLTAAQVKEILAGRIANWKEVGGDDLPIIVFTDAVGAGTRTLVQVKALGGENYGAKTQALENIRLVAGRIAELKGGCGFIGSSFLADGKIKAIETDRISRPLGFISKGDPSPNAAKVIAAFKATAK